MKTGKAMLVNIQWLRFVAAFAVVLYHATPLWPDAPGWVAAVRAVGFAGASGELDPHL